MSNGPVRRITWRTADAARILGLGVVFLFLWKFFWMVHTALFLGLIALLIAIVIHAPARFLAKWLPFHAAFALTIALVIGVLAALGFLLVPPLSTQLSLLAGALPAALRAVASWIAERAGDTRDPAFIQSINQQFSQFIGRFVPLAFNLISVVVGSIAILVLAIFLAAQPELYRNLVLRLIPPEKRESARRIYDDAGRSLRNWILAKAVTMVITGVFIGAGLALFEVPGALALGVLAGVLEFIPTFGPTIAATPAVITAFLVSPGTAVYVAVYYFAFQQLQAAVTVPLLERHAVRIPPAALLLWQLMLAVGFGILGLFVATPLLAVLVVVIRVAYLEPTEDQHAANRREPSGWKHAPPALAPPVDPPDIHRSPG